MKTSKNFTIDEELIPKIIEDARFQNRSDSFIVNQILKDYYEKKEKKKSEGSSKQHD